MAVRFEAVSFDVSDAVATAAFWAGLLDREAERERTGAWVRGDETQVGLRFVTSAEAQQGRPRLHLHVTSSSLEDQQQTVEQALRLGGRHLDVGQGDEDQCVVLADPGGNELCVMEPENNFLAGTGRLGEVTCDGSRAVGRFWSDALGWPLVWDEGEQTAIQSRLGGTKIAWDAWDAWDVASTDRTNRVTRQRFDLVSDDLADDVARLASLGATLRGDLSEGRRLTDPDGKAFTLRTGT